MFIDMLFVVVTAIIAWHGLTWRDETGESDAVRLLFGAIALLFCVRVLFVDIFKVFCNYLPPPYTIFGKGEENSSRNEVKTFWLRLGKVEMAAWIRA